MGGLRAWWRGLFARPAGRVEAAGPALGGAGPAAVPVLAVGDDALAARLLAALRGAGFEDPAAWVAHLAAPCRDRGIVSRLRLAHYAATIGHESGGGTRLVESLDYRVEALMKTWPARFPASDAARMGRRVGQNADQRSIAERAYGGRMGNGPEGNGDGWKYRGRGLIQCTGKDNYRAAERALQLPLLAEPELLQIPRYAARSAAWWWAENGCNELADRDDVQAVRRRVNGGLNGLEDVERRLAGALAALG